MDSFSFVYILSSHSLFREAFVLEATRSIVVAIEGKNNMLGPRGLSWLHGSLVWLQGPPFESRDRG